MTLPADLLGEPGQLALFLDFDGTLVELEERPERVRLSEATRVSLATLRDATNGALAIVTGRDIDTIDGFLQPLRLPVAGVHGLTRRTAAGNVLMPHTDARLKAEADRLLAPLLRRDPALVVEHKTAVLALHYRMAPAREVECLAVMEEISALDPCLRLTRNKMVIEVGPAGANKGTAIAAYMREPPFAGRVPMFAGDDVTDEDAFAVINARDGISIKVGPGPTIARWRAASTAEFGAWLHEAAKAVAGRMAC